MEPTAILMADSHLRDDVPECRTDDFWSAQAEKVAFLKELQTKYKCPILDAGDTFNRWKSPPYLEAWAIWNLPNMITVPGNHELPGHNINFLVKSSLSVLEAADKTIILTKPSDPHSIDFPSWIWVYGVPWGKEFIKPLPTATKSRKVAIAHYFTYKDKLLWPGMVATQARRILKANPGFDLIVTGHNHHPFVEEYQGRLLVNPGCMTRQKASEADIKPRVYLWYAESNKVRPIYYPIREGVVSRAHIEQKESYNERLESFVARIKDEYEVGLSFSENLEAFFSKNKVSKGTKDMVMEACDEG